MFNSFPQPKPDSGGSNVKSIQSGLSTITAGVLTKTVTISAVDLTKSIVRIINGGASTITTIADAWVSVVFTSPTQLTFTRQGSTDSPDFAWEVIEFNGVKSLQRGQVSASSNLSNVTISPVNLSKSLAFCSASTSATSTGQMDIYHKLTTSTNLEVRSNGAITKITEWQVIEFN